jgi:hypothetical protein
MLASHRSGSRTFAAASSRGAPRFETGDERYAWLNNVQGLAVGETDPRARIVCYDIYSLD